MPEYTIFRCDRSDSTSSKLSGGGVLIAIRDSIPCQHITSTGNDIECLFVLCKLASSSVLVGNVYIPPGQPTSMYSALCDTFDEIMSLIKDTAFIVVMGDFNLPNMIWTDPDPQRLTLSSRYVKETFSSYELTQVNRVLNHRGVSLDLIFSNNDDLDVRNAEDVLLPEDMHHPALSFSLSASNSSPSTGPRYFHDFRRCNVEAVFDSLLRLNYPILSDQLNIENDFNNFCTYIGSTIKSHSPIKKSAGSKFPHWFSNNLRRLIIAKKALQKKYKSSLSHQDYLNFQNIRRVCKLQTLQCHSVYLCKIEYSIPSNMKSFWSYVKCQKSSSSLPSSMFLDSEEAADPEGKCNLFAEYFSSVFRVTDVPQPTFDFGLNLSISSCKFQALDVQRKLEALDPNKGAGPDDIPPAVLK
ncbi:uncharacterized protein LOC128981929 [Macrosteles quadrilineatus]|uniref:uncharacterized protein LOC128981929 n=1 Tax=Macrosteles quadrilineatus TaxID=74068 RepID=UPI0023E0AA59|nr:uncharacterized protein LOC128981929 [Macrosteles quadrilineatus]